jgi:hypothetical protein
MTHPSARIFASEYTWRFHPPAEFWDAFLLEKRPYQVPPGGLDAWRYTSLPGLGNAVDLRTLAVTSVFFFTIGVLLPLLLRSHGMIRQAKVSVLLAFAALAFRCVAFPEMINSRIDEGWFIYVFFLLFALAELVVWRTVTTPSTPTPLPPASRP